ncbi:UNVERIFIED_CONTAM: hypothetical protein PYX00_001676 [Menopon gallinae]|uniref:Aquaporin n=1 Tax=Menopon gallinae TaxID=328185 RepID=A0AAW2IDP1_9NEOP
MSNDMDDRQRKTIQNVWWYIAVAMSETIGTALLVFLGCSSAVPSITSTPPSHIQICLVFGFAVCIIIQMFGHVSGAHLNPAVTVSACIFRLVPVSIIALYFVSQLIGGILGYGAILSLYPAQSNMNVTHGFCTTVPNPGISTFQAFLVEFFASSILILICCGVWDKRNANKHDSAPIKFGLAITAIATPLGPYTGGSMNPARSFAPALFTGVWNAHWIYWLAPISAGVLVTYFYKFVFDRQPPPPEPDQSDLPLNQSNFKMRNADKTSNEALSSE